MIRSLLAGLLLVSPAAAGIWSPDEPFVFEIDGQGNAAAVQFPGGGFKLMVSQLRNTATPPKSGDEPPNASRQKVLDRLAKRKEAGIAKLSPAELAGYTADLMRVNNAGEALNLLQPLARDPRRGGFLAYAHLAQAMAAGRNWREAFDMQSMAVRYSDFPAEFPGMTKTQLAWLKRVERDYYLPLLALRAAEPAKRRSDLREDVDALFPATAPPRKATSPVRFTDGWQPGLIAPEEKAQLPPDALAIVQQLVLWLPTDARLYWLLGELYNAEGDVETAAEILDHCSFNMGYSNPLLIQHKQALQEFVAAARAEAKRSEDEKKTLAEAAMRAERNKVRWIVAIAVALVLVVGYYQSRELIRRLFRRRA